MWLVGAKMSKNKLFKPCHKLGFCPYGPLVEQFPCHEAEAKKARELGYYAVMIEGKGWVPCTKGTKGAIEDINRVVSKFGILDKKTSCSIFGHNCPVFHVAESFVDEY
jgi:hypothetical protein